MSNVLLRKLESFAQLPEDDKILIASLTGAIQTVEPHEDIIREDEKPNEVNLVISGFASL